MFLQIGLDALSMKKKTVHERFFLNLYTFHGKHTLFLLLVVTCRDSGIFWPLDYQIRIQMAPVVFSVLMVLSLGVITRMISLDHSPESPLIVSSEKKKNKHCIWKDNVFMWFCIGSIKNNHTLVVFQHNQYIFVWMEHGT